MKVKRKSNEHVWRALLARASMIKLARPVFSHMSHLFGYDTGKDVPGVAEKIRQQVCGAKLEVFYATADGIHGSSLDFSVLRGEAMRIRATYKFFFLCDK